MDCITSFVKQPTTTNRLRIISTGVIGLLYNLRINQTLEEKQTFVGDKFHGGLLGCAATTIERETSSFPCADHSGHLLLEHFSSSRKRERTHHEITEYLLCSLKQEQQNNIALNLELNFVRAECLRLKGSQMIMSKAIVNLQGKLSKWIHDIQPIGVHHVDNDWEVEELEMEKEEENDDDNDYLVGGTFLHTVSTKSDTVSNDINYNDEGGNAQEEPSVTKRQRISTHASDASSM